MNIYVFIAGIVAALATIGHFTAGQKLYLNPILNSNADPVPKKIMQSIFHYVSVFMVLSSLVLLITGIRGEECMFDPLLAFYFIGLNYLLFAVVQILIILTSKIKGGILKMFQWIFWLIITILVHMGIYC